MQQNAKIIFILSMLFVAPSLLCPQAFAQQVEVTNIHTSPQEVHAGNSFQINATIANNSTEPILLNGGCRSPLSATFDKNVAVTQAMGCFAISNLILPPGHNATVAAPGSGNSYTAASPGATDANLTFVYRFANNTEDSVSKKFTFVISDTPIPEFPDSAGAIFALAAASAVFLMNPRSRLFRFFRYAIRP